MYFKEVLYFAIDSKQPTDKGFVEVYSFFYGGIDFILDPMWAKINASLFEHIDGLKSQWGNNTVK